MTCKDCVHYEVCNIFGYEVLGNFDICVYFKDKSKFTEIPLETLSIVQELRKQLAKVTAERDKAVKDLN